MGTEGRGRKEWERVGWEEEEQAKKRDALLVSGPFRCL
jgi:hypothetical protein